jgi:uncharacterized protein involved in exopolysaccharide biosynthesis
VEIVDYLKAAGSRLWIILIIPVLAAAGVLGHWQLTAKTYDATAYVFAPDVFAATGNQFSGPAGTASWVNQFSATAVSPQVTHRVAAATGVPAATIAQGLKVTQVQQSGQLEIRFSWTDPSVANEVVKREATATPKALFAPQVAQAKHALAETQDSLQAVNQDILNASTAWGRTRPDLRYAERLTALAELVRTRRAINAGDVATLAVVDAKIARVRARVAVLQRDVVEFSTLKAQRQAATTVLARAQVNLQLARAEYAGAVGAVTVLPVKPARLSSVLLKGVLAAVVAGLLVGLCLIAALELLRSPREALPAPVAPTERTVRRPSRLEPASGPSTIGRSSPAVEPEASGPRMVNAVADHGDG